MLASIGLTSGIDIPHGEWSSVTLLVVIGGLQHHCNIRKKAAERAGDSARCVAWARADPAAIGSTHSTMITLLAVIASVCAYHAIGKPGCVVTAITTIIVVGHGDLFVEVGL